MGLDCSHDAFHGAYSAFNRLRQCVCAAIGGSFPPHWKYRNNGDLIKGPMGYAIKREDLDDNFWYWGEGYNEKSHPGLFEFLRHSDCDGVIDPEMCIKVADDLESILPKVEKLNWDSFGHIQARGGFVEVLKKFINGCREAATNNEFLDFH